MQRTYYTIQNFSELYGIPLALMASELVVNSAFGLMGY